MPKPQDKPFAIPKPMVWEAWRQVKANKGAAGVDGQALDEFEADLRDNLYKIWNRMSSGCYFPPPVRAVEIPKPQGGGIRMLGVPTIADRVAQTVVAMHLEERADDRFHPDSYGYRPNKSAHEAVEMKLIEISKRAVWEAYRRVKANKGGAGVDEQSIAEFEVALKDNLYKLWNRLSSGTYFPPPVRAVEIPKRGGSSRTLGVPTVADRIAQTVVRGYLEPGVEPVFHEDSYGYRPGRSAHDAIRVCRERCWRNDWVLDMDIRKFFDSVPWELTLKAVAHHTDLRWVLLYVERWLKAPLQREDGSLVERDRGTPQGSAISPLLANMLLHYAFDAWMARRYPAVQFERYCDDIIVHARSERHARMLWGAIASRLAECGLELNEQKTRIVYCKDDDRRGSYEHTSFDFLSYTFRPRLSKNKFGKCFVNFSPAVSGEAKTRMRREMRRWSVPRRSDKTLTDLALMFNATLQGWINYYGRFYKSMLYPVFRHLNETLVGWAMRKYKRLRRHRARARRFIADVARRQPGLFAHWRFGVRPDGWTTGAR